MIEIKDISGKVRFATEINTGSKRKFLLMKEDYITLKFSLNKPVHFKLGDFVEDARFGLFEICDLCKPSYNPSNSGYDYELRLDAYYWKWKNKLFKYMPETTRREVSWNLTASLDMQMGVLLKNLKVLGYTYNGKDFECSIDNTVENKAQLMSYSNTNLLDAVFQMANKWNCECWITENIIHFGRYEFGSPINFELGENVDTMTRSDSQTDYATRIYAFGSTRNIPSNYRRNETTNSANEDITVNGIVQKRLMLPINVPYIDAFKDMPAEEAVEGVVIYEDIFPKNTGVMSDITTKEYIDTIENEDGASTNVKWNAYRFKDTSITFSKKYILPNETPKITFQSGLLNGMEFEVMFNPCDKDKTPIPEKLEDGSWNPAAQVWEILRNEDYGRPIPDEVLMPKNGDTFVLSGFDVSFVSDTMIPKAEKELEERAKRDIEKRKVDPSTYEVKMMSGRFYSEDGQKLLEVGSRVNLVNSTFFETGSRESRIIGLDYNLDMPYDNPVYTVGETASYSRVRDLEDKIDSITFKGQNYAGTGGSGIYLITSNDITPATDKNTFSAKRIIKELTKYLHKDKEDETDFPIKFLGGLFTDYIQSLNYSSGPLGAGLLMKVDPRTGKSYIEVDELFVRIKAMFTELEIKKLSYMGGNYIFSAAGMKCTKIEEYDNYWRCYLMVDDGETAVENPFREGDQVRYQTFNIKPGKHENVSNRYYWRLCVGVGNDYIDLSKTDCDAKSDIPQIGDSLVQLGNRTDQSRQNAITLSVYGDDAPSIHQYAGINAYSMEGKEVTVISPKGNKFLGDFVSISTGKSFDDMFRQIKTDLDLIKEQADKEYTLWFFDYEPTLDNIPASEWTNDADKAMHEQDMFYNREVGLAYRFEKIGDTWRWNSITDQLTVKALENASHAQETADGKQRTFVAQPTDEQAYDVGDQWVNATIGEYVNDQLVCIRAKAAGEIFSIEHWKPTSGLTNASIKKLGDSILLKVNNTIESLNSSIELTDEKITALVEKVNFDEAGNVTNINTSGLVTDASFAGLFSKQATVEGLATQAQISAFITRDQADNLISNATIQADNINFIGKTVINGSFVVDETGNLTLNNITANNGVFRGKFITAANGTRIEISPDKNTISMFNSENDEVYRVYFVTEDWQGATNYYPRLVLRTFRKHIKISETSISSGSINSFTTFENNDYGFNITPTYGLSFLKNGIETKRYANI